MTPLSPAQWRMLGHLYFVKPGNVHLTLDDAMKAQEATAEDALGLISRGLIQVERWTDDSPAYVRLSDNGQRLAGGPLGSAVWELSSRPVRLNQMVTGPGRISLNDLRELQEGGLIDAVWQGDDRPTNIRPVEIGEDHHLVARQVIVRLTKRGRDYVVRQ